jgi:hypothetical protein
MHILHRRLYALSAPLLTAAILLAGCAPQQTQPGSAADAQVAQKAWDLRHAGDYEAAAQEFLRASGKVEGEASLIYRLYAAETYLNSGQTESARAILADFDREQASTDIQAWAMILAAHLSMLDGQPELAVQTLDAASGLDAAGNRARDIHALKAAALVQLNRPLEAVDEHILIEPLLGDPAEVDANRQAIWDIVSALPAKVLQAPGAGVSDAARGWAELALLSKTGTADGAPSPVVFRQWRQKFPNHPGESLMLALHPALATAQVATFPEAPLRIALLLPVEGQAASAGSAVRDGVIAAWLADERAEKPVIDFYNATAGNAAQAFDSAAADGAELVIGPLEKGAVDAVLRRGDPPLPMIALNQYNGQNISGAGVVQFALQPEEEARQVADRARADGHIRAWVMTPDDSWGERVYGAFRERWEALGGTIVDRATYNNQTHDFASPVKQLLDIEGSQQRAAAVEAAVQRPVVSEPHPTENADFLFLAAFSLQARQIQPQLLFFGARELPIYATSHVYLGTTDPSRDADLNGITFADMPALVGSDRATLESLLDPDRADKSGNYERLFAMGVDAYRLAPQVGGLRQNATARFSGQTGELSIDSGGVVQRTLSWARFVDGLPVPVVAPATLP